jgi:hypothetical protein
MKVIRKPNRRYLFYRAFCATTLAAWLAVGIYTIFAFMYYGFEEPAVYGMFVLVGLVPFLVPAIILFDNLTVFKFPFSVFGPFQRTPFPEGEPLLSVSSGGVEGLLSDGAHFTWHVFPEGIGFNGSSGVGEGFIPVGYIRRTEKRLLGGVTVWHDSPEVRSPLIITSTAVRQILQERLGGATQPV